MSMKLQEGNVLHLPVCSQGVCVRGMGKGVLVRWWRGIVCVKGCGKGMMKGMGGVLGMDHQSSHQTGKYEKHTVGMSQVLQ